MKVGIVSLNQAWEEKDINKSFCKDSINLAFKLKLDLLIFPEMTLTGFSMNTKLIAEKIEDSKTIDFFRILAIKYNIGIVFGVCLKEREKLTNCAIYISKNGTIEGIYRKIYPFTYADEHLHFSSGNEIVTFQLEGFTIGLTICYDLRFPELYRLYTDASEVVINIANWPEKRIDHWNTLLKARAIENQYIVIGVNRTGTDGNQLEYIESSNVYLPDGSIQPVSIHKFGLKSFKILPEVVKQYRESFPVLKDRINLNNINSHK